LDPVILAFLLPITLKRYCIQIFSLFSRTCQAREIREIKGTRKKQVLQYLGLAGAIPQWPQTMVTTDGNHYYLLLLL